MLFFKQYMHYIYINKYLHTYTTGLEHRIILQPQFHQSSYIHTVHTYIHTYMHTYIHLYIHLYINVRSCWYTYTHIQYIHTVHTYITLLPNLSWAARRMERESDITYHMTDWLLCLLLASISCAQRK